MTSARVLELLLLLLLLLRRVYSEEAEPVFRAKGAIIEMGYCFGVDYIVVYRCAPEGDLLLGNSSADSAAVATPADLRGRIDINKNLHLLGLQISQITHKDSGIYRRECWQNQARVSQHTQQLTVCDEEVESVEITTKEGHGGGELFCNNTSIGSEGTSVRWYREIYPLYKPTLFLDTSVSLDPIDVELQGVMEVQNNGARLLFNTSMLKNSQHFICLVSKGERCLSFQNMYPPDRSESSDVFATQGESVLLKCPSDGNNQHWETPLGRINGSSVDMNILFGDKSEDFSLVIPAFSDKFSGHYSCISSSLEMQYLVVLCPEKKPQGKVAVEGGSVSLDCGVGKNDSQRVQWYRREPSGRSELIHSSGDRSVPIPEDLRGRLSESGFSLTISHLEAKDQGDYWCVVLAGHKFLEADDDYEEDFAEDDAGEDEFSDGLFWEETHSCIHKQEIILNLTKKNIRGVDLETVTLKPTMGSHETGHTPEPPAGSNGTAYAVGAGVVGLLAVGVIAAVIAIKKRTKSSTMQRGPNTTKDMDPACTVHMLTQTDKHGAAVLE